METVRIEANAVIQLTGVGLQEATLLIFQNGEVNEHKLDVGNNLRVGYFIDAPENLAEQILLNIAGSRMIDDSLEAMVAAELQSILVEAQENPNFNFGNAVGELVRLFG